MKKANQTNLIGIILGIILGVILNAYLIWDVSYYGILNKHSPIDFIWSLHVYIGAFPLDLIAIFVIVQMSLTTIYCILFSTYLASRRKIIPPSFVLLGSSVPLMFITEPFFYQHFQEVNAADPMNTSYFLTFFLTFLYVVFMYLTSSSFDQIVRNFIGAWCDEKQIEQNLQSYSSKLSFKSIVELMMDPKWLKDYASLSITKQHIDEEKKEASLRFKKVGTDYYLCISVFHNLVLIAFYELLEDRFGKEQNVGDETKKVMDSQIELIKKQLGLSETTTEVGFLKSTVDFATQIAKVPLERIMPYKLHAFVVVFNIIALVVLSYLNSIKTIDSSLVIAVYTLILMVSLELGRSKTKGK